MILTENGVLKLMQRIKSFITSQLNTKAASVHTHSISEIDNLASQLGDGYSKSEVDTLLNSKADSSHTHTSSDITDLPSGLTVDSTLDSTSSNAISNSAVVDALDDKANKSTTLSGYGITDAYTKTQVDKKVSDLVNSAPETLDTLNELASALGNDPNFATTVATQIGNKANASDLSNYLRLSGGTLSGSIAFSGTCYTSVGTGKELSSECYVVTTTKGSNLGGSLYLYGGDSQNSWGEKGNFRLVAQSKEKGSRYLLGTPSGSLTWNSKELATQEYVNTNLVSKANDSDVVHKSGDETVGGNKDFSGTTNIQSLTINGVAAGDILTHNASEFVPVSDLSTVATSGSYNDLSNKPTIPTVNNATLTIQKNGTTVKTFTANASSNVTANITVPTKTSDLTNDSGFLTSHQSLSNYSTLANTIKSLSISGKTITYTKGDDTTGTLTTQDNNTWTAMVGATSSSNGSVGYVNAVPPKDGYNTKYLRADGTWQVPPDHTYNVYNKTLTIQKNGTNVATFTSNSNTDVTANISVPTKTSDLTNDSGFLTSHQDLSGYIPLAGTSALAGNIVPSSDFAYDMGSSSKNYKSIYTASVYHGLNTGSLVCCGGNGVTNGAYLALYGASRTDGFQGRFDLVAKGSSDYKLTGLPTGTLTWGSKNVAMQEDVIPRSGGNVLTGSEFARTVDNDCLILRGSTAADKGASFYLYGKDIGGYNTASSFIKLTDGSQIKEMHFFPNGTWTWNGTACQITSDQRLKQQITNIDDKLLDAWQDVEPVQFKYNDAVNEKGDNARLHTGYVVQQISEACQKHDVNISDYGLYCHEEYPERTEEVTIDNEDGTTTKETKVIEPAKEHYSLRYTETLVVECAYLRRENSRLKERLSKIEKILNI